MTSSRAVKRLFLSFTSEDIGVAMVTNIISRQQESFLLRRAVGSSEISSLKIRIPARPCNILYISRIVNIIFCWIVTLVSCAL